MDIFLKIFVKSVYKNTFLQEWKTLWRKTSGTVSRFPEGGKKSWIQSVSYTHLDVYKRQDHTGIVELGCMEHHKAAEGIAEWVDVYKRQPMYSL